MILSARDFPIKRLPPVWNRYSSLVDDLAKQGAKIVVLPEKIEALSAAETPKYQARLAEFAKRDGVFLAVGVQLNGTSGKENVLWLFDPSRGLIASYLKQHMVPHLESDLTPGHENVKETIGQVPFGLVICRDLLFANLGREYGRLGVSALLVPAWDFYVDAWMASSEAELRGIENGYAVVRAGRESYLNISDRYGHVIARRRSDFLPGSSLLADLPVGPPMPTLYTRYGNWFGWVNVVGLAAILFWPARQAKQAR